MAKSTGDDKSKKDTTNWAQRDLDAINKGVKSGYTDKQRDSVAKTFDQKAYDAQIATQGTTRVKVDPNKKKSN